MEGRESVAKKVTIVSVWWNSVLTVGKVIVGTFSHSDALVADGIHSAADVFASIMVLAVISISNKPADEEHPYGHGKAEVIVSGIIGLLLLVVSLYIVYEAIIGFFGPIEAPSILAMWVALFSFGLKLYLYKSSLKIAGRYNSKALEAIANDHKADIVASIAAATGIFLSVIGAKIEVSFLQYSDKIASIFVAYLIYKISREMVQEAFNILLERNVDQRLIKEYIKVIKTFTEVKRIDKIRARDLGHYILIDLRIAIDHDKTIKEGHDLARRIKVELKETFSDVDEVLIHINPYFEKD